MVVTAGGTTVTLVADPLRRTLVLSIYSLALMFLYFVFQAPDVALSEIVVGTVGLPLIILAVLRKLAEQERSRRRSGSRSEPPDSAGAVRPGRTWSRRGAGPRPSRLPAFGDYHGCVLFSGVMIELGVYAVARLYWVIFAGPLHRPVATLRAILVAIGVVTALLGAVMCFLQRHVKRLLAFSSISHVGIFVCGVGLLAPEALAGVAGYVSVTA